jgi:MinD-like ATPase involved in chromosome partitioning or flagellar assembly
MTLLSFSTSLNELLGALLHDPSFAAIERCCVIRDLQGRLRLAITSPAIDGTALAQALSSRLGGWFVGPVLSTGSRDRDQARLASHLIALGKPWPQRWPGHVEELDGSRTPLDPERFLAIERVFSKEAWLAGASGDPPWSLQARAPKIISFYSFKGGVGRSTTLAAVALLLASSGKRVLCVDLDLEAPGLASLFQTAPEPGVIDFLLSSLATGSHDASGLAQDITVHGTTLQVVPAGLLGRGYLEKLARLDYLSTGSGAPSPVAEALRELLRSLRKTASPDYILLDSRAGLHDLGGLSLNDLSHVDVLVGRNSTQGLAGLDAIVDLLAQRRGKELPPLVVAQTFGLLPLDGEESQRDQQRYRERVHGSFARSLYAHLDDQPGIDDPQGFHFPWVIGRYDELAVADIISSVSLSVLHNDAFTALATRLREVCESDEEDDEVEENT